MRNKISTHYPTIDLNPRKGKLIMNEGQEKYIYIPAKPGIELSETVLFYMVSLVPKGKLTTMEDIECFLAKKLNTERIEFSRDYVFNHDFINEYTSKRDTYFNVPLHRNVSSRGLVEKRYAEDLKREGFIIEETKVSTSSMKVRDYKRYLISFEQLDIDMDLVMRINKEGLSCINNSTRNKKI